MQQGEPSSDVFASEYDVVVVGSGAGGMVAAMRAADKGLRAIVVEKELRYGGTSATSGGFVWIPNHGRGDVEDSREAALTYLAHACPENARQDRIEAFVDGGPEMVRYLDQGGIALDPVPLPDYFSEVPGASAGRMLSAHDMDGGELGDAFYKQREQPFVFKLFNRYALNLTQSFALTTRPRGWQFVVLRLLFKYWSDISLRRRTKRDRRLTLGGALAGRLRKALMERNVPVVLGASLEELVSENGRIVAARVRRNGRSYDIAAKGGVVLAAGGFEQNQEMRDRYLPVPTEVRWSQTPRGGNMGGAITAGRAVGAATEWMGCFWWAPSMQLPSTEVANTDVSHQMWFDNKHPNSVCVNRLGRRFVNESCSYDRFGLAMIEDQKATGANVPCWMVFDATFRKKYSAGGLMPNAIMPDRKIPQEWWDSYIYRADSIEELAGKIEVDASALADTVKRMNHYAAAGVDEQFGRGEALFDRAFGDQSVKPNPCLGPIDKPPFYAIRVDLGDLGSKGGLKADVNARVLNKEDQPIEGLYAIGNCSGSPFADAYPGGGSTLGPAMVFGFLAADDIAARAREHGLGCGACRCEALTGPQHKP